MVGKFEGEKHESSEENKSRGEGNPIQISKNGIIFTISLWSEEDYKKNSQKPLVVSFKNLHHHFWGLPLLDIPNPQYK